MASAKNIALLALDIGGVIARFSHTRIRALLAQHHINPHDFFDDDFEQLQRGQIHPRRFIDDKCRNLGIAPTIMHREFAAMMIQTHALPQLSIPYIFASNINQLHYETFLKHSRAPHHARTRSLLSFQLGFMKPEAGFFQCAVTMIGKKNISSTLFVDDKQENIASAQFYGFQTHHLKHYEELPHLLLRLRRGGRLP